MAKVTKELIVENTRKYLKTLNCIKPPSLATILNEIGVSKGVFYYYFNDKDELLYEVIIPVMKQKENEISKKISTFPTLKERLHFMFEIFTDDKLANHLNEVENFYIHLFFDDNLSKSKSMRKVVDRISKKRKSLILQQIRYYNIKITNDINILIDYIIDTMIFYHIFHSKLNGKTPKREIVSFIDMLCKILENEKPTKKRENCIV